MNRTWTKEDNKSDDYSRNAWKIKESYIHKSQ